MRATSLQPRSPHLCQVLGASRAQLQRQAQLTQSLQLAVWANREDELTYSRQSHHTLSVYLAGGRGSQLKGDVDARGEAGRFCIFPAQHESSWLVREPVRFLHLYVSDQAWAERVVRLLDAEPRSHLPTPQIYARDAAYLRWAQTLDALDWSDAANWLQADALSQQILDGWVLQSATPQRRQAALKVAGGLSSVVRRRVLDFVDAHLADCKALTLSALAQVACLSEFHFARMFHQSMDCTVHDWVLQRRLGKASSLLAVSGRRPTLADVAAQAGFSSASHLLRSFRLHLGMTPAQFAGCSGRLDGAGAPRRRSAIDLAQAEDFDAGADLENLRCMLR